MTRQARIGHTTNRQLTDAQHALEDLRAEFEQLETEHGRYRRALIAIADDNTGHWGWVARDALHSKSRRRKDM